MLWTKRLLGKVTQRLDAPKKKPPRLPRSLDVDELPVEYSEEWSYGRDE
jgi:hypothetical protein